MDIKPFDRTIKNVLEGGFYKIPRFQRPYSWDKENVDDFWTDTVAAQDADYFIGAFVVFNVPSDPDLLMVVDGQQRLTTITLLFAALRNAFDALKQDNLAAGIQKLIEREDINNEKQFILQSETPYPFLQEYIQKRGEAEVPKTTGKEEEALGLAFSLLTEKIESTLSSVDNDQTVSTSSKQKEKRKKLISIRDKVLRLQLIVVQLANDDDAYMIFETLNTRGKNLGVADLVKNHLTRLLKPKNKNVDVARDKWNSILETLDASAADIDANRFIYHAWLSRNSYLGEKKLFKAIKKNIKKGKAADYLDALVSDVARYRRVLEPEAYNWTKQEREIKDSVQALKLFRVVQPVPLTLAILRDYYEDRLTTKQTRKVFHSMEDFHVQFTAVTAQRTGGGTARMYAASAEDLYRAKDKDERAQVLKEFVEKLRDRIPSYQEFEANFKEIIFLSGNTKQRPLVRYLLRRFDNYLRSGTVPDYEAMTIEHIAPENPGGNSSVKGEHVGMIGNLIFVPQKLNEKAANKSFKKKKTMYQSARVPLDEVLTNAKRWTNTQIEKRTSHLAMIAYEYIFKV